MTQRTRTSKCPPDHKHGTTSTCYTGHKCGCDDCYTGWNERSLRREKLHAYGRYVSPFVDASEAREHVGRLLAAGMNLETVADLAGVHRSTLDGLMIGRHGNRPSQKMARRVADAVLAVQFTYDIARPDARVPSRGVVRRLQALMARGWSITAIAAHMGVTFQRVEQWSLAERTTAGVHRRVAAAYEELWDQAPPIDTPAQKRAYSRTINRARRNGWAPPAAWDDIDLDSAPPAVERTNDIDWVAVEFVIGGQEGIKITRAERHEVVKVLHARHWSDGMIADLVGRAEETIFLDRKHLGLEAFDQTELLRRDAA